MHAHELIIIYQPLWRPILVKIVIIKSPRESVFAATFVLFISLLCIFIGGIIFFFEVLLIIIFLATYITLIQVELIFCRFYE